MLHIVYIGDSQRPSNSNKMYENIQEKQNDNGNSKERGHHWVINSGTAIGVVQNWDLPVPSPPTHSENHFSGVIMDEAVLEVRTCGWADPKPVRGRNHHPRQHTS